MIASILTVCVRSVRSLEHELSREDTVVPLVSRNLLTFWWVKMAARWSSENVVVEFRDAQVHSHYTCTQILGALEVSFS